MPRLQVLKTNQKIANDGIFLVQTTEGTLTEVHSMLNRMVKPTTHSATSTYSSANRAEIQKEIKAMQSKIDRSSKTSDYNGTTLFSNFTAANGTSNVTITVPTQQSFKP